MAETVFNFESFDESLPVIQSIEEKERFIDAAADRKVGVKKPFIVGVEGQEGEEMEGEEMEGKEVKKYLRGMYIKYDKKTKSWLCVY